MSKILKWPRQVDLIRHAESSYNQLKDLQAEQPLYLAFEEEFARDPHSAQTRQLADQLVREYQEVAGDSQSKITEAGRRHMIAVGKKMAESWTLPDVVVVSPYVRTKQSLSALIKGWPALAKVRIIEEERIREREFGLRILYGDYKVYQSLHPEQHQLASLQGPYWYRYPQGENIADVRLRLRQWTNSLMSQYAGKHVLVMTHHVLILAFRANMERLTSDQYLHLDKHLRPDNCSITTYKGQVQSSSGRQRLRLKAYNRNLV